MQVDVGTPSSGWNNPIRKPDLDILLKVHRLLLHNSNRFWITPEDSICPLQRRRLAEKINFIRKQGPDFLLVHGLLTLPPIVNQFRVIRDLQTAIYMRHITSRVIWGQRLEKIMSSVDFSTTIFF